MTTPSSSIVARPSRAATYLVVAALYVIQGMPMAFFAFGLPGILRDLDISLQNNWVAYAGFAVYALKFLWAPVLDRHWIPRLGRRRTWILLGAAWIALVCAAASFFPPAAGLVPVLLANLALSFGAATLDIATDAYTLEALQPEDRGLGNGFQIVGWSLGSLIGNGAILMVYDWFGWQPALLLMGATAILGIIPVLLRAEAPAAAGVRHMKALGNFFRRREVPFIMLLVFIVGSLVYWQSSILSPLLIDSGLSVGQVGQLTGFVGAAFSAVGALSAGYLTRRLGFRGVLIAALGLYAAAVGAATALAAPAVMGLGVASAIVALTYAGSTFLVTASYTNYMNWCSTTQAGTDYAVMMSTLAVVVFASGSFAGLVAAEAGYRTVFGGVAAAALVALFGARPLYAAIVSRVSQSLDRRAESLH